MDIACPHCAAAYRVPDALVMSRKPVRCAACGHRWVPDLPAGAEAAPAPETPARPVEPMLPASFSSGDAAERAAPPEAVGVPPALDNAMAAEATRPPSPSPAPETAAGTGALPRKPATPPPLAPARGILSGAPRRPRGAALLPMAWVASIAAVAGLFLLLWAFRQGIAEAWPPFGRVVLLLGG